MANKLSFVLFLCFFYTIKNFAQVNISTPTTTDVKNKVSHKVEDSLKKVTNPLSQYTKQKKTFLGGDFSWSFGQTEIFINCSPLLGYKLTDKFQVGGGIVLQYWKSQIVILDLNKGFSYTNKFDTFIYGTKGMARYFVFKGLFINSELEFLNTQKFKQDGQTERTWKPVFWIGTGYNLKIYNNFGITTTLLYNPFYDKQNSAYNAPYDIRIGCLF